MLHQSPKQLWLLFTSGDEVRLKVKEVKDIRDDALNTADDKCREQKKIVKEQRQHLSGCSLSEMNSV